MEQSRSAFERATCWSKRSERPRAGRHADCLAHARLQSNDGACANCAAEPTIRREKPPMWGLPVISDV